MPLESRLIPYADLRPCKNAFIDTRSAGSESKENVTLIGPGASVLARVHHEKEVIFLQNGTLDIITPDGTVVLGPGDTFTTPKGLACTFRATSSDGCIADIVCRGNAAGAVHFVNAKAA
jgi:hypothetical protein